MKHIDARTLPCVVCVSMYTSAHIHIQTETQRISDPQRERETATYTATQVSMRPQDMSHARLRYTASPSACLHTCPCIYASVLNPTQPMRLCAQVCMCMTPGMHTRRCPHPPVSSSHQHQHSDSLQIKPLQPRQQPKPRRQRLGPLSAKLVEAADNATRVSSSHDTCPTGLYHNCRTRSYK